MYQTRTIKAFPRASRGAERLCFCCGYFYIAIINRIGKGKGESNVYYSRKLFVSPCTLCLSEGLF